MGVIKISISRGGGKSRDRAVFTSTVVCHSTQVVNLRFLFEENCRPHRGYINLSLDSDLVLMIVFVNSIPN